MENTEMKRIITFLQDFAKFRELRLRLETKALVFPSYEEIFNHFETIAEKMNEIEKLVISDIGVDNYKRILGLD